MTSLRQLNERTAEGGRLRVEMLWDPERADRVKILVAQPGRMTCFNVKGVHAADAFKHPFVYMPEQGKEMIS